MKKPVIEKISLNFGKKKRSLARSFHYFTLSYELGSFLI